jgi:hypothetical protein
MPGIYTHTTRAPGTILTATIYNTDHQNHIDHLEPIYMDDYSVNSAQMRTETDPGENGTESLAGTLAGELERIRFSIREWKGTTYWYQSARSNFDTLDSPTGFCLLRKSGANIILTREGGRILFINGKFETVPAAGVTLAPTSLLATTLYYIYAFMNAGVMTLEASTTAPAADATYGHQIKTGDATRTWVGMAYPPSAATFTDTVTQRLVLSYFSRRLREVYSTFSTTAFSTSTADIKLGTKLEFLSFADEAIKVDMTAHVNATLTGHFVLMGSSIDGSATPPSGYIGVTVAASAVNYPIPGTPYATTPAVGYHSAQPVARTSNANGNNIDGSQTVLVRG